MSAPSGSARSSARSRARSAAAWSPSASRAIASSSVRRDQPGSAGPTGAEPSRTGASAAGRRLRVVLGEPQRRGGDADLAAVAVLVVELGQDLLGALGLAEAHQGVQQQCPRPRGEQCGAARSPASRSAASEGGQRLRVTAARQLEQPADVVEGHHRRGLGFRSEGALGALDPGLCLLQPSLPGQRGSEHM